MEEGRFFLKVHDFFGKHIHKIIYNDSLANLRTQSQTTVEDVVSNYSLMGLSAFVHVNSVHIQPGLKRFLAFNKTLYIADLL